MVHRLVDPPRTWAAPEISSRSPGLPEEFTGPLGKSVLVGSVRTLVEDHAILGIWHGLRDRHVPHPVRDLDGQLPPAQFLPLFPSRDSR